jgi:cyclopropane fatty-acyl-phospholipid synthase-like methyltransferase
MDRNTWLKEQRSAAEKSYNEIWAAEYGEKWGLYSNTSHRQYIQTFLSLFPQPVTILDAACGAGRYFPMLLERGHTVFGIDQAQGMLDKASRAYPGVHLEKTGLQEMSFQDRFEGAICMDALEHVSPEDWPTIFHHFHSALIPQGHLYFTVEVAEKQEIEEAFRNGQLAGLPLIYGEWPDNDGVYHYYPSMPQVREWLQQAGFEVMEEGEGDGYHHYLTRSIAGIKT